VDWSAWQQQANTGAARGPWGSRWNPGKALSFVPLRPERVVEVRFRHMAQFVRWRPDRDPRSCTYDPLEETVGFNLGEVLATTAT
jgi:ATP-dependent DNA ligase